MGTRFELVVCSELLAEVADALRKPYFAKHVDGSRAENIVAGIAEARLSSRTSRGPKRVARPWGRLSSRFGPPSGFRQLSVLVSADTELRFASLAGVQRPHTVMASA